MSLPVLDNLKRFNPAVEIEVWCGPHCRSIYDSNPAVDRIVAIPDIPAFRDIPSLVRKLRSSTNDGFFVLDRSRLISAACRLSGVTVLGTVREAREEAIHETDRYLETLAQAGIPVEVRHPSIELDTNCEIDAFLREHEISGVYAVLHPGGAENPGSTMHSKRWPASRWKAVIQWLESRSIAVILSGASGERSLCEQIASETNAVAAAGDFSLIESATLASHGLAYVGPDTGLSHLVAATGTPTIVIFGPTNPNQYAPQGKHVSVLAPAGSYQIGDTDLRKHQPSRLPKTDAVSVESVISALEAVLNVPGVTG